MSNRNRSKQNHPQDHKPPRDKPRTVTVQGISLTIDPKLMDDWELVELLYDYRSDPEGNALAVIPFLRKVLGDGYARVKDALRDPNTGRISGESMGEFVEEMMEKLNDAAPNS